MTIANSAVSDHFVFGRGYGGGIATKGELSVVNSTVSRNSSSDAAGIVHSGGGLTVRNSTIASNRATRYMGDAAGINTYGGGRRPTLGNTIVALNTFEDDGLSAPERSANCSGPVTSSGHNLENGSTCRFNQRPTSGSRRRASGRYRTTVDRRPPTRSCSAAPRSTQAARRSRVSTSVECLGRRVRAATSGRSSALSASSTPMPGGLRDRPGESTKASERGGTVARRWPSPRSIRSNSPPS